MKGKKKYLFIILFLLGISVVYALLLTNLNIGGFGKLSKNEWNIYFDNIVVKEGSVSGDIEIAEDGSVVFNALLDKPGDYYEFSVDVNNSGTIDAVVDSYLVGNMGSNSNLIDYEVKYFDGMDLSVGDRILSKEKDTLFVKVLYKTDINPEDLNAEDIDLKFEFNIEYVQDFGTGVDRKKSLNRNLINDVRSDVNLLKFEKMTKSADMGIYELDGIYFFRGGVINNNVVIEDSCYYALLTDKDGNIKLLYNGDYVNGECNGINRSIGNSVYTEDESDLTYENSVIRNYVLDWYQNNLSKYDEYIVGGYCVEEYSTIRNKYDNGIVDINCDNTIQDKAALLSIDDIILVGYGSSSNYRSYLYNGISYYTMNAYSEDKVIVIDQMTNKNLGGALTERPVRPVIKIKANSPIKEGDGSMKNPFVMDFEV